MKVSDLPPDLRAACIVAGMRYGAEISPRRACGEWARVNLGDPNTGYALLDLYNEATAIQNRENLKK